MKSSIIQQNIPQPTPQRLVIVAILIGCAVFFILAMFQPFGTYTFQHPDKLLLLAGYGFVITFTVITLTLLLSKIFHGWFAPESWNLRRELLLLGIVAFASMTATYFYHFATIGSRLSFFGYAYFMGIAMSTSLFPLALLTAVRYLQIKNYLDQRNLTATLAPKPDVLTLTGDNKTEKLTILRSELLLLKAADNYVELFLQKDQRLNRHLLRGTLSGMASQLDDDHFLQVHRSYIVNMNQVVALDGKSPNYILRLAAPVEEVPVSRNKVQAVRQRLAARPL